MEHVHTWTQIPALSDERFDRFKCASCPQMGFRPRRFPNAPIDVYDDGTTASYAVREVRREYRGHGADAD